MKNIWNEIEKIIRCNYGFSEYSFERFKKDRNKRKAIDKDFRFINSVLRKEIKLQQTYLELIVEKNELFSHMLHHYLLTGKRKSRPGIHNSMQLKDFTMIQIIIGNNYRSIMENFLRGLNYQAKVLFRNTIELTELAIGILGDEELHGFYRKSKNRQEGGGFVSLKYNTVRGRTEKILKWVKTLPNNNMDPLFWDGYAETRQNLYEQSSSFIHSNFESIYTNAYVQPMSNKYVDFSESVVPGIGGVINTQSRDFITEVLIYENISYFIILILLIEKYHLPLKYFDQDVVYASVLIKSSWDLLGRYIKESR